VTRTTAAILNKNLKSEREKCDFQKQSLQHTKQCTNCYSKEKDAKVNSDKYAKVIDSRSYKVLKVKVWIKVRKLEVCTKVGKL